VVRHATGLAVLRRLDPQLSPPAAEEVGNDLAWLHGYLARLAAAGFPAPCPVMAWEGTSWTISGGAWWELVSYLPGRAVGWEREPPLQEVGAMLARFHAASTRAKAISQRPIAFPVGAFDGSGLDRGWRRRLDQLAVDLDGLLVPDGRRQVIHGDLTAHNVLANGRPSHPCAVIDFGLAHQEDLWADIGYGLWRSGRPHQVAVGLDRDRVGQFVYGYQTVSRLPLGAATAIPVYARARGLQQAVKACRQHVPIPGQLEARVDWLTTHRTVLTEHIVKTLDQ
jgi:Ser/Thr protein kinase RdoA (MazF antagonist)